jgi:hypothetical protein
MAEGDLKKIPLLSQGTAHYLGEHKEYPHVIVSHDLKENETFDAFLERLHGGTEIPLDCAIFAQIVHQAENPCSVVLITSGLYIMSDNFHYISPMNEDIGKYLQKSTCQSKGEWVIKVSDEQDEAGELFLGLGNEGPVVKGFLEWAQYLKNNIRTWSDVDRDEFSPSLDSSIRGMTACYLNLNMLDTWIMARAPPLLDESPMVCHVKG